MSEKVEIGVSGFRIVVEIGVSRFRIAKESDWKREKEGVEEVG